MFIGICLHYRAAQNEKPMLSFVIRTPLRRSLNWNTRLTLLVAV